MSPHHGWTDADKARIVALLDEHGGRMRAPEFYAFAAKEMGLSSPFQIKGAMQRLGLTFGRTGLLARPPTDAHREAAKLHRKGARWRDITVELAPSGVNTDTFRMQVRRHMRAGNI